MAFLWIAIVWGSEAPYKGIKLHIIDSLGPIQDVALGIAYR